MAGSVDTDKGKHRSYRSDEERQAICGPSATVDESLKHVGSRAVRRQIDQRYEDAKESEQVNQQDEGFDLREHPGQIGIGEQSNGKNGIE